MTTSNQKSLRLVATNEKTAKVTQELINQGADKVQPRRWEHSYRRRRQTGPACLQGHVVECVRFLLLIMAAFGCSRLQNCLKQACWRFIISQDGKLRPEKIRTQPSPVLALSKRHPLHPLYPSLVGAVHRL